MITLQQAMIGYINHRRSFTEKAQFDMLRAAGVAEKDLYVEGRGAESLEAALKRSRDGLLWCADGMRALGNSAKSIREAMALVEKKRKVIVDALRKQRSDLNRWEMYDYACGKVIAEKNGLTPHTSRKGGMTKAAMRAHDRLDSEKAQKIWRDPGFSDNETACAYMNKLHPPKLPGHDGWTPQTAFRHFGGSGRKRGRKAFKTLKRK